LGFFHVSRLHKGKEPLLSETALCVVASRRDLRVTARQQSIQQIKAILFKGLALDLLDQKFALLRRLGDDSARDNRTVLPKFRHNHLKLRGCAELRNQILHTRLPNSLPTIAMDSASSTPEESVNVRSPQSNNVGIDSKAGSSVPE